jgi:hypothetical protein
MYLPGVPVNASATKNVSAGVIEPCFVIVMRSCSTPIPVDSAGW